MTVRNILTAEQLDKISEAVKKFWDWDRPPTEDQKRWLLDMAQMYRREAFDWRERGVTKLEQWCIYQSWWFGVWANRHPRPASKETA